MSSVNVLISNQVRVRERERESKTLLRIFFRLRQKILAQTSIMISGFFILRSIKIESLWGFAQKDCNHGRHGREVRIIISRKHGFPCFRERAITTDSVVPWLQFDNRERIYRKI